jgi:hypothetical protein
MYNREEDLKKSFNDAMQNILGVPSDDYYTKLSIRQVLSLKSVLSDINNIVTLRLAFLLGTWICNRFQVKDGDKIATSITACKPNANGFDIQLDDPNVVAEVKCNIPINGGITYGSAQKDGLIKDIRGLLLGKSKSKKKIDQSIKILGLYDTNTVRKATSHLVRNLPDDLKEKIAIEPAQCSTLQPGRVYVIYLK